MDDFKFGIKELIHGIFEVKEFAGDVLDKKEFADYCFAHLRNGKEYDWFDLLDTVEQYSKEKGKRWGEDSCLSITIDIVDEMSNNIIS